jgi:glutaredoxin
MKRFIVLALIAFAGYLGWQRFGKPGLEPLYDQPYVVVYGRESCGYTTQTLNALKQAGIDAEFMSVDDRSPADELHERMQRSGLDTRRYLLPVVDLNNSLSIRPGNRQLVEQAEAIFN